MYCIQQRNPPVFIFGLVFGLLAPRCVVKVDCAFSGWSNWTMCSTTCDFGQQIRNRKITVEARGHGTPCMPSILRETKVCQNDPCVTPTDCVWSSWNEWDACTKDCGGGQKKRFRDIVREPRNGGKVCAAHEATEIHPCNTQDCPVILPHCEWSAWSNWELSVQNRPKCGDAQQQRTRHREITNKGAFQEQEYLDLVEACRGDQIERSTESFGQCRDCKPVNCLVTEWSSWSRCPCSALRTRHRVVARQAQCGGKLCAAAIEENEPCDPECWDNPDVNCDYSDWTSWSQKQHLFWSVN